MTYEKKVMSSTDVTIKSVLNVIDVVGKLAGVLVGLSAIAYFVGYKIQNHYLTEAGANWAIGLLSSAEFIQEGQAIIVVITLIAISSAIALMSNSTTADKLRKCELVLIFIAFIIMISSVIVGKLCDNRNFEYGLALAGGSIFSAAAGCTLGELIARLNHSNQKWQASHLNLVLFIYIWVIFLAPYFIGTHRAKLEFDPQTSTLSFAVILDTKEEWRLVRTIGDKYLLAMLSVDGAKRKFRIVDATSDIVIKSNSKNLAAQKANISQ